LFDTENPSPYPVVAHAVIRICSDLTVDKPERYGDNGVRLATAPKPPTDSSEEPRRALFSCRSLTRSIWHIGLFTNRWIIGGVLAQVIGQVAITYLPAMNSIFDTAPISLEAWLRILAIAAAVSLVVAVDKRLRNRGCLTWITSVPRRDRRATRISRPWSLVRRRN
ncbi:MAG: cation transporting ATPase C-terminal domain-containing protein, partial [Mycobacterium sp.]